MRASTIQRSGIALLVLAVAACQSTAPSAVIDEGATGVKRKTVAPVQSAADKMRDNGLETPSVRVKNNQFQVRKPDGSPAQGALLELGAEVLTADAEGLVTVPTDVPETPGYLLGVVRAEGMVPARVKVLPGFAVRLSALDGKVTPVSAASGGRVSNADGTMEVTFSPNALDRDAQVRVTRVYVEQPASIKAISPSYDHIKPEDLGDNIQLGSYSYNLDLGGATIQPGASVRVEFKAEKPLNDYITKGVANKGDQFKMADQFAIDEKGQARFSMVVPAPAPLTSVTGAAAAAYKLLSAVCNRPNDPQQISYQVCTERTARDCRDRGNNLQIHDPALNNGHCVYVNTSQSCSEFKIQECRTETTTVYHQSSTINAYVAYQSDDSRYAGKVASGARVSFSHGGTPVRAAGSSGVTGSNGYTWVYGAAGASGVAQASMPGDAGARGNSGWYSVNCGTVNLLLFKMMPQVVFAFQNEGTPIDGSYTLSTSHGAQGLTGFGNQTKAIAMKAATAASEAFSVTAANFALGAGEVDYDGASGSIGWNQTSTISGKAWHNTRLNASAQYDSNDNTVPADQQPSTKWAGQGASDLSYSFQHRVSGSPVKRAGRDVLSFAGVTNASAWGLNGASSVVTATRSANGVTLTGTANGTVGGDVRVGINARLPKFTFNVTGDASDEGYVMNYTLTDAAGNVRNLTMAVPKDMQFRLPVEEAVNQPGKHQFKITNVITTNGTHALTMPDGSMNFPSVEVVRAKEDYSLNVKSTLIAPK